ncbi:MAG: radical SAM protein [Chloroflexi bacterium]|nr:radical SAM protein [Chloroflexota bacterium]
MPKALPRLPLDGRLDLTYRCNNTCRHCWLWLPSDAPEARAELSFDEYRRIIDEARAMGCHAWGISGGEPMLRPDFAEILDYITRKAVHYKLNTNATLITPAIARLLTRPGNKMVALYGATGDVHDHITRNPGSFEAMLQGVAYLQEAGAGFSVQIVPMRDSYHQFEAMVALAASLSPVYRVGAPWLWLSGCRSEARNREIARQRLAPEVVLELDPPNPAAGLLDDEGACGVEGCGARPDDDRLLAGCLAARRDFHIDPYGQMSFCCYIKDPALRYDLRRGTFREAWNEFIPSLADVVRGGEEYRENCGTCELRSDCRWCPTYGWLEHGRYSAKVEYLCSVARATRAYKQAWRESHVRHYQIAGVTIQLSADFELTANTFAAKFAKFAVAEPGEDAITLRLASGVPTLADLRLGEEVYARPPWRIYRNRGAWVYLGVTDDAQREPYSVALFNSDHSDGTVYRRPEVYAQGGLLALSTFTTDQIWLAPVLARRQAFYLHSSAIILNGQGYLFVGHSEAGKSTMLKMLRAHGEILCDDRNIVRRWPDGYRVHGTWSHGELPDVSPAGAPLRAVFFLDKATHNELVPVGDRKERFASLLAHVVRPLVTADWWASTLDLAADMAAAVPAYRLRFDLSGQVVDLLKTL